MKYLWRGMWLGLVFAVVVFVYTKVRVEVRGSSGSGDFLADMVLGQPDFSQTNPNQVVGNRTFHPQGVVVDRNSAPNRIYITDSGNSRILGFSSLGKCLGSQTACTNDRECPGLKCVIEETKKADMFIGQKDEFHGTCNGDNTERKAASATSLCLQPYPFVISLMESPEPISMAVDLSKNLFVFDKYNNRVLKYNDPIGTDVAADKVWGQNDFVSREPNRGSGSISRSGLNLSFVSGGDYAGGGVDVDSHGNVWVTDIGNHRVLRFPASSTEADLVIGQKDFVSAKANACRFGSGVNPPVDYLCRPKVVRYNAATDQLFVIDWPSGEGLFRVLIFNGPDFTNGMAAAEVLSGDWDDATKTGKNYPFYFRRLVGLEIDPVSPRDTFWLSNTKLDMIQKYKKTGGKWQVVATISSGLYHPGGNIGIDSGNNLYAADLGQQDVKRFSELGISANQSDSRIVRSQGSPNFISGAGFRDPSQVLLMDYTSGEKQLLVSDRSRVLYWNDYSSKNSGAAADGVLFEKDVNTVTGDREISALTKDSRDRIWMAGMQGIIYVFKGPVKSQDTPLKEINVGNGLPIRGGGTAKTRGWITGIAYDENNDALWVADAFNHRLLRISQPLNSPMVDMVLGQPDNNTYLANRGVDNDDDHSNPQWQYCSHMVPDGFGSMGGIFFDNYGNLFVVDGGREGWQCSNNRLLEFERTILVPDPKKVFFAQGEKVPKRVYGGSEMTVKNVHNDRNNIPYTPIAAAFSKDNKMVVVADGYGNNYLKRAFVYNKPLDSCSGQCWISPSLTVPIPGSQLSSPSFDKDGNLAVLDHTWNRVLIFRTPFLVPDITVTPSVPVPTLTGVPTAGQCSMKGGGDANCDGLVAIADFAIWKMEFIQKIVKTADFDNDGKVTIFDFSIWKMGFLKKYE